MLLDDISMIDMSSHSSKSAMEDITTTIRTTLGVSTTSSTSSAESTSSATKLIPSTNKDLKKSVPAIKPTPAVGDETGRPMINYTDANDPTWMVEASRYLLAIEGQGDKWQILVRNWMEIERCLKYPDGAVCISILAL